MDNVSYFFVFWHMQLYMSWYIRSFFGFTFLNILYSFKYSCTNIFHRRSLYTFYSINVIFWPEETQSPPIVLGVFEVHKKLNSLAPETCASDVTSWVFKIVLRIDILITSCKIGLMLSVTGPHWWQGNIGSGNELVPSGNKPLPEPISTLIYVAKWRHYTTMG